MTRALHVAPAWRKSLLVALSCLAFYHSNGLVLEEVDAIPTAYVAWSLVRHGDVELGRYPDIQEFRQVVLPWRDGAVSRYPPGAGLAAVPFVAPLALRGGSVPSYEAMRRVGKWTGSAFSAAAVALFYWLAAQVAPRGAIPSTLLFGLGTALASTAAQAGWSHGPATFWLLCGICLLWKHDQLADRRDFLVLAAGFALGSAGLTRPLTLVVLATAVGWAGVARRPRMAVLLGLGAALPLLALGSYNLHYFESVAAGGYVRSTALHPMWATPTHLGLLALLFSPSRGLLIFSPALILALAGLHSGVRWCRPSPTSREAALGVLLLGALAQTLVCATWRGWHGGWSYGPRLLIEALPAWALLTAVGYERWATSHGRRGLVAALIAGSVAIQLIGMQERSGYHAWHRRLKAGETSYWSLRDNLVAAQVGGPTPSR